MEQNEVGKWLHILSQAFAVGAVICTVLYFPIKKRFESCEASVKQVEKIVQSHCEDHKISDKVLSSLATEIAILNKVLSDLKEQLKICHEDDKDLRDKFYEFLKK